MKYIKKIDRFFFIIFPVCIAVIPITVLFTKLSMMQTDNMLSFSGAILTYIFGLTALMYARGRAVTDPVEMAVRAEAADECLKACIIASTGIVVTAFAFLVLQEDYTEKMGYPFQKGNAPDVIPMMVSVFCLIFLLVPLISKMTRVIEITSKNMNLDSD